MKPTKPLLFILGLIIFFNTNSCSLVTEAASVTANKSRKVPQGHPIQGSGFIVKSPGKNLYPIKNYPVPGAVTLRNASTFPATTYYVAPFETSSAKTPTEALQEWNNTPMRKGVQIQTLETKRTSYRGYPAVEAKLKIPTQSKSGNLGYLAVVKLAKSRFIILSCGTQYHNNATEYRFENLNNQFQLLKNATTLQ
ncbi:MAG: hypothetical protein AAGC74_04355 [Verrucomicrobiota bacterium]